MLDTLKISARPDHESAQPFAEACLQAQADADANGAQIVIGWQINDATGDREPGWGPLAALNLLTLEPVAMLYPIQRNPIPCKRKA
jgi:hypothetical protein